MHLIPDIIHFTGGIASCVVLEVVGTYADSDWAGHGSICVLVHAYDSATQGTVASRECFLYINNEHPLFRALCKRARTNKLTDKDALNEGCKFVAAIQLVVCSCKVS
jgi:hypothetical protein